MKKALQSTFLLFVFCLSLYAGQAQSQESHPVNFPPNPSAGSSRRNNNAKATPLDDKSEKQAANDPAVSSAPVGSTDAGGSTSEAPIKNEKQAANDPAVSSAPVGSTDAGGSASDAPIKNEKQAANDPAVSSAPVGSTDADGSTSDAPIKSVNDLPFASVGGDDSSNVNTPTETKTQSTTDITVPGEIVTDDKSTETEVPPVVEAPASSAPAYAGSETSTDPARDPAPTSIYRVGVGDVLDIQLLNSPLRESTLYSVLSGGLLEYPLAGEAIKVEGLTTDEISNTLISMVKIYEQPQIKVSVREYASHNVIITGLVRDPGTKALRREAVPLFVVLADAQPRPDAARAVIMRTGSPVQTIDISDTNATSALVYANDVIRLVGAPPPVPLFFYIAGQIAVPGQRDFHSGMTLTQAIFASGGVTRYAGTKAKVMRQGADGRLLTIEYNLKKIEQGKDPDPGIEAGDRIEVSRGGW